MSDNIDQWSTVCCDVRRSLVVVKALTKQSPENPLKNVIRPCGEQVPPLQFEFDFPGSLFRGRHNVHN